MPGPGKNNPETSPDEVGHGEEATVLPRPVFAGAAASSSDVERI